MEPSSEQLFPRSSPSRSTPEAPRRWGRGVWDAGADKSSVVAGFEDGGRGHEPEKISKQTLPEGLQIFPMQSSSHTPRPQRRGASGVDRDGLDLGKSCSELGQVYLLTEPGKTGEDKRRKERRGEACPGLVPVCQLPVLTPSNHKRGIWTCFTMT